MICERINVLFEYCRASKFFLFLTVLAVAAAKSSRGTSLVVSGTTAVDAVHVNQENESVYPQGSKFSTRIPQFQINDH